MHLKEDAPISTEEYCKKCQNQNSEKNLGIKVKNVHRQLEIKMVRKNSKEKHGFLILKLKKENGYNKNVNFVGEI